MKLFGGFHGKHSGKERKPRPEETEEKKLYAPDVSAPREDRPSKAAASAPVEEKPLPPAEASPQPPREAPAAPQPAAETQEPRSAEIPAQPRSTPEEETPPAEKRPSSGSTEEPTQVWDVEVPDGEQRPAEQEPPSGEEKAEGTKEIRFRTPEEEAEIEEIIAAYQKKKKRRRLIVLAVLAVLAIGGYVLWKSLVKPPEIVQPTPKPTPTATAQPTVRPTSSPAPGEVTPEPTPEETPIPERMRRENVYTFMLVGRDQGGGNTDTIMLGVFDAAAGTVDVVSIPRDTCANVDSDPKKGETKKISGVYARAEYDGLRDALADIAGFPIDCYVSVGINGFIQLVNTIGGVNFDVPYYMNYDDPTQNLHIHFSPGMQYLNGYDAIKVVRWRQNNDGTNYGDIARINTQQAFLKTVFKQCLSLPNLVSSLDDYIAIFQEYVKTDLTTGNMTWFAKEFLKLDMENIHFHTVPCEPSVMIHGFSYGTVLVDEWLEMLNESLNPYDQPITLEDLDLIYRDENGNITATSGEIRGGMDSFLTMEEYMRQLQEWNDYLDSLKQKEEQDSGNGGGESESASPADDAGEGGDTNGGE